MIPRNRRIAIIGAVFSLLNLQLMINRTLANNLMLIRERMQEQFALEGEQFMLLISLLVQRRRRRRNGRRRAWAWPRPQHWFDLMMTTPQLCSLWKPNFRMNRETFESLCDVLQNDLIKQETRMRRAVPVETRVAVGLWRLASGNSYRSCGLQFGLGKSTAKMICQEFEEALGRRKDLFIRFPYTADQVQEAISNFEELYSFPQIVGAIDGCHIEINGPPENRDDYFNTKQFYSINLQGIVNSEFLYNM